MTMTSQKIQEISRAAANALMKCNNESGTRLAIMQSQLNGSERNLGGHCFQSVADTITSVLQHYITIHCPVDYKVRIAGNDREKTFFDLVGIAPDNDSHPEMYEWYWTMSIDDADRFNEQFLSLTNYEFQRSVV